jgi:hypothetical protein
MTQHFPEGLFDAMGHVYGKDKEGRPVMYNIYGGHKDLKAVFADVQLFIRLVSSSTRISCSDSPTAGESHCMSV